MLWITLKRIVQSGVNNFKRNGVVSLASVLVVTVTLLVGLSLMFLQAILRNSLAQIEDKVDVNIYFTTDAASDEILALKSSLEELPEVASVTYVSAEEALLQFRERHQGDYLTLQALDELGGNPLGASLNIRARETSQYEGIARFIENENALEGGGASIIDSVNYEENKVVIDRLSTIIDGAERLGFLLTLVFAAISVIITFNTIRLTIYIAREEINVMSLVGASRAHTRGPFMVEGVLYGAIASILALAVYYPVAWWLGRNMTSFLGINLHAYYMDNFLELLGLLLLFGVAIGAFSSFLAIRKYLAD